jgi:hypothetical protein
VALNIHETRAPGALTRGRPTYTGDVEATRRHAEAWRMLALVAERVVDLPRAAVRT